MTFRRRKLVLAKLSDVHWFKKPFENVSLTFSWINVSRSIFSTALEEKLSDKCDSASYRKHIYKAVVGNCIPSTLSWNKIKGSYVKCRVSYLKKAKWMNSIFSVLFISITLFKFSQSMPTKSLISALFYAYSMFSKIKVLQSG